MSKRTRAAKPGHERGRPKGSTKALSSDPNRYLDMWAQAHIDCGKLEGKSEISVLETLAGLRYGRPVPTRENFEAMARGDGFKVYMIPPPEKIHIGPDGEPIPAGCAWPHQNSIRPFADSWRRRLRHKREAKDQDGKWTAKWFAGMSHVAFCCLQGFDERAGFLEFLAEKAGEKDYFNTKMRPVLIERAKQRRAGLKRADVAAHKFFQEFFVGNILPNDSPGKR